MSHTTRTFVIDTNVLLYDPQALEVFEEHDVVIPMTVIEEVDRFKKDMSETGRNARHTSRYLDQLRGQGSLREGVALPGGGRLWVDFSSHDPSLPINWGPENNDNRILRTVMRLHAEQGDRVALITRDVNMRLKCDALGVAAEDYEHSRLSLDEQWSGVVSLEASAEILQALYASGEIHHPLAQELPPQTFVVLRAHDDPGKTAMARVLPGRKGFKLVGRHKEGVWGVFARNKEQLFAMELLLDPEIKLVTLNGMAGTGKTLLALACGLMQVADRDMYRKLLVSRPISPLGKDLGFLPGDIGEKLDPWMKPIFDNLDFLISHRPTRKRTHEPEYRYLLDQKIVEVEALTYIRGRSIPEQFLIVDEAQNLTPHEVKTVLTRAGEGTKVVMTGDPQQIDNPYVDEMSNGLTYAVERFKDADIAGHVTLRKGERSELAELAAKVL